MITGRRKTATSGDSGSAAHWTLYIYRHGAAGVVSSPGEYPGTMIRKEESMVLDERVQLVTMRAYSGCIEQKLF